MRYFETRFTSSTSAAFSHAKPIYTHARRRHICRHLMSCMMLLIDMILQLGHFYRVAYRCSSVMSSLRVAGVLRESAPKRISWNATQPWLEV